jgi:hypothetical protein
MAKPSDTDAVAAFWTLAAYVAIVPLVLVIIFWQYILAALFIFGLVLFIRLVVRNARAAPPALHGPPKRVKAPKAIEARPVPVPGYQPRWTVTRRKDAKRELKQWQDNFDSQIVT